MQNPEIKQDPGMTSPPPPYASPQQGPPAGYPPQGPPAGYPPQGPPAGYPPQGYQPPPVNYAPPPPAPAPAPNIVFAPQMNMTSQNSNSAAASAAAGASGGDGSWYYEGGNATWYAYLFAFVYPPLGMCLYKGNRCCCNQYVLKSILLSLCFYLPGLVYTLFTMCQGH